MDFILRFSRFLGQDHKPDAFFRDSADPGKIDCLFICIEGPPLSGVPVCFIIERCRQNAGKGVTEKPGGEDRFTSGVDHKPAPGAGISPDHDGIDASVGRGVVPDRDAAGGRDNIKERNLLKFRRRDPCFQLLGDFPHLIICFIQSSVFAAHTIMITNSL